MDVLDARHYIYVSIKIAFKKWLKKLSSNLHNCKFPVGLSSSIKRVIGAINYVPTNWKVVNVVLIQRSERIRQGNIYA